MDNRHFSYSKFWSEYQAGERRVRTTSCNNICPGISPISRCYFSFYHYFRNPFLFLSKFKLLEVLHTKSRTHLLQNKIILFINGCISCHYFTLCSNLKTIWKCLLILCIKRKQLKGKCFFFRATFILWRYSSSPCGYRRNCLKYEELIMSASSI